MRGPEANIWWMVTVIVLDPEDSDSDSVNDDVAWTSLADVIVEISN